MVEKLLCWTIWFNHGSFHLPLQLIARGKSNREIATALAITEGTVKGHVNNILGKLGVNDRTGAVTTAIQRGIVHMD